MSEEEYYAMHREAEHGDDKNKYDFKELERAFADLDKDTSSSLSLDEWRRPFEEHTDKYMEKEVDSNVGIVKIAGEEGFFTDDFDYEYAPADMSKVPSKPMD